MKNEILKVLKDHFENTTGDMQIESLEKCAEDIFKQIADQWPLNFITDLARQRQIEMLQGKNAHTCPPLYVVYNQTYSVAPHNSNYSISTSLFDDPDIFVRFIEELSDYELADHPMFLNSDWDQPFEHRDIANDDITRYTEVVRVGFHDQFVTCCFTRQAAENFIANERHNLINPRIWVDSIMRRNVEFIEFVTMFGGREPQSNINELFGCQWSMVSNEPLPHVSCLIVQCKKGHIDGLDFIDGKWILWRTGQEAKKEFIDSIVKWFEINLVKHLFNAK